MVLAILIIIALLLVANGVVLYIHNDMILKSNVAIRDEVRGYRKDFAVHFNDGVVEKLKVLMQVARANGGRDMHDVAMGTKRYDRSF